MRPRKLMRTSPMQAAMSFARMVWYAGRDETFRVNGHRLRYVPGTRPIRLRYRDDPDAQVRSRARQLEYFAKNVKPGDTVVDAGGNVGRYAVLFGSFVGPDGTVVSFEPNSTPRALLERNVALNKLGSVVHVEPMALFDKAGTHSFYSRRGDSMGSLERAGFGTNARLGDIREHTVHTVALDDYLVSNGLRDPDWLKIDVEGAEINVLRGSSRALHGKTKIVCELHPYAWDSFGTSFEELESIVGSAGRKMTWLDDREHAGGASFGTVVISW